MFTPVPLTPSGNMPAPSFGGAEAIHANVGSTDALVSVLLLYPFSHLSCAFCLKEYVRACVRVRACACVRAHVCVRMRVCACVCVSPLRCILLHVFCCQTGSDFFLGCLAYKTLFDACIDVPTVTYCVASR